jgi:hypothetical protein
VPNIVANCANYFVTWVPTILAEVPTILAACCIIFDSLFIFFFFFFWLYFKIYIFQANNEWRDIFLASKTLPWTNSTPRSPCSTNTRKSASSNNTPSHTFLFEVKRSDFSLVFFSWSYTWYIDFWMWIIIIKHITSPCSHSYIPVVIILCHRRLLFFQSWRPKDVGKGLIYITFT